MIDATKGDASPLFVTLDMLHSLYENVGSIISPFHTYYVERLRSKPGRYNYALKRSASAESCDQDRFA